MNLFNQFSYLFFAGATLALAFAVLRHYARLSMRIVIGAQTILIAAFLIGFLVLRPGGESVNSASEALETVGNGKPTMLFFFSNYCALCITVNPIVEQLETDITDEFNLLRIDIHTTTGRAVRQEFGFSFTPEFVLFDKNGNEVWRDHIPPSSGQLDRARSIAIGMTTP